MINGRQNSIVVLSTRDTGYIIAQNRNNDAEKTVLIHEKNLVSKAGALAPLLFLYAQLGRRRLVFVVLWGF